MVHFLNNIYENLNKIDPEYNTGLTANDNFMQHEKTGISKAYQQVTPAEIFQFEIFGMKNNLITINKNKGISVFS